MNTLSPRTSAVIAALSIVALVACGGDVIHQIDAFVNADASAQTDGGAPATFTSVECVLLETSTRTSRSATLPNDSYVVTTQVVQVFGHTWTGRAEEWWVRRTRSEPNQLAQNTCAEATGTNGATCERTPSADTSPHAVHATTTSHPLASGSGSLLADCGRTSQTTIEVFDSSGTVTSTTMLPMGEERYEVSIAPR